MPNGAEPAYDYPGIQKYLAGKLLRELWSEDRRREFFTKFVTSPVPADATVPPIVGVGISETENGGVPQLEFLSTLPAERLRIRELLFQKGWEGIRFNIRNTGRILACSRPLQGGDPVGLKGGPTGTFGCLVADPYAYGERHTYILSCNHVLASLNRGQPMVDEIWSQGTRVGHLARYKKIVFGPDGSNQVDAALCRPDDLMQTSPELRRLRKLTGRVAKPALNIQVRKEGYATGLTHGSLLMKDLSHTVWYDDGQQALFEGQLAIIGASGSGRFAGQGDSGAVVVDAANAAVGLLSSVSKGIDISFVNPIAAVLEQLEVILVLQVEDLA
jgi:hypothetical protein